jgi:hypothetical protein
MRIFDRKRQNTSGAICIQLAKGWCMKTDKDLGDKGEVKPRVSQDVRLEDKIDEQKDEEFAAVVEKSDKES